MKYLKSTSYYEDLYDIQTIKRCLSFNRQNSSDPLKAKAELLVGDLAAYFESGERFKHRAETIREWILIDEQKDKRVEDVEHPRDIRCNYCSSPMDFTSKELHYDGKRVMFWFECIRCNKRRLIFEDGEEYLSKTPETRFCPKCSAELTESHSREGDVITTLIRCTRCRYKSKEIIDLDKDNNEWEEKERKDRELLRKYRSKYCLSAKEGNDYISMVMNMEMLEKHLKEKEQKESDPAYQKAKKLKILKVLQLKSLIQNAIEKESYTDLQFGKPEIDRFVIIGFTVSDSNESREKHDSIQKLKRIISLVLEDTNWRLMSEGISYRLGILSGKLKAYESDDDLMKIVK